MFCCAIFCVLSSFAIILVGKREVVTLLYCLPGDCDCYCSVALPRGAVGLSAVCNCGIS